MLGAMGYRVDDEGPPCPNTAGRSTASIGCARIPVMVVRQRRRRYS